MKPTAGRIVFVEKSDGGVISNGATYAPAIVTQVFAPIDPADTMVNATMFAPGQVPEFLWSAHPKGKAPEGYIGFVWYWPPREGA